MYDLSSPFTSKSPLAVLPAVRGEVHQAQSRAGVNAQYIQTSNHMGTHLDARGIRHQRHDDREIPVEWLCGPGVIVDCTDEWTSSVFHAEEIEDRVEVKKGDLLSHATRWERQDATFGSERTRKKYIHRHPARIPTWCVACSRSDSLLGVDCVSTDHPESADRPFLGKACHGHCDGVRKQAETSSEGLKPSRSSFRIPRISSRTNALFPKKLCISKILGADINAPTAETSGSSLDAFP